MAEVRQVEKTFPIQELEAEEYTNTVYVDFENHRVMPKQLHLEALEKYQNIV